MKVALKEFKRNISSTEYNSEARLAVAYYYVGLGKRCYDKALEQVELVVKMKPDLAMARSALGWLYIEKGLKEKGMTEIKKALRLDPEYPLANNILTESSHLQEGTL